MFKRFRSSRSHKHATQAEGKGPAALVNDDGRAPALGGRSHSRSRGLFPGSHASSRRPSPSPQPKATTLGLHVIHRPAAAAPVDIIFVHGLGGDSRKTWSRNHDPNFFWPELWLPLDPDIGKCRILTFGYNASFGVGASRSTNNITDFAKELLYEMGFGRDDRGEDLGIGKAPIVFVAHSMGGLVVKKAYLQGQNDQRYQSIVHAISGIVFLATPHRGTDLATILNRVLMATFQSPKSFIDDLKRSSPILEEVNDQFRHVAPRLSIVSFYETLATRVGLTNLMILTKDTATLGYPQEVSRNLNANHHDVCKYSGPDDPNYIAVLNMMKSLVAQFRLKRVDIVNELTPDDATAVEELLAMPFDPEEDFNFFRHRWTPGTCGWILQEPIMQDWLDESRRSHIVWFSAPPASGKSILSSYIIHHLRELGVSCQYFFFRFGDQRKRSTSSLLRSIASQLAKANPDFRRSLIDLWKAGLRLEKADVTLIWQKLYESVLFKMQLSHPLYWVIDALDESESPKPLLGLFRCLEGSSPTVRLLLTSRKTEVLTRAFDQLSRVVAVNSIEKGILNNSSNDIRAFVEQEITEMRGSEKLKRKVAQKIMNRADGNFLWVRLVLEEILHCHTEEAIEETLDAIPSNMNRFYERMELAILNSGRKSDQLLAKEFLLWTICARRALTIKELAQALKPKFPEFLDLRRTIHEVCGQFVVVDQTGQIGMVHQTARDYLIKISKSEVSIDPIKAHKRLFMSAISALLDPGLRMKVTQGQSALRTTEPFLLYAATSWAYHLQHTDATSNSVFDMLLQFFRGPSVLVWIHLLALVHQLETLVKAARALSSFVNANRKMNVTKNPMLHRLSDLEFLDQWIIDLVKVVGKFSRHLLSNPEALYKLVPPFCPEKSILHRQFHEVGSAEVFVSGISNEDWHDNLVRITLPNGDQGWKIECAGQYVAVLGSSGTVYIWRSDNFSDACTLCHHEAVTAMCFNKGGSKLITYGLRSTKLWSIPSGQLLSCTSNPVGSRAMTITFSENDKKVLIGSNDRVIRYLLVDDFDAGWYVLNPNLLRETAQIEGAFVNSPVCIAFNGDASQVGVSYRGYPLSVWALNEARCIGRCRRVKGPRIDGVNASSGWFAVDRFTWNPISGHIIGLYKDGNIFKWHPVTDETQEVQSVADEIAASSDGKLFVTSSSNGTVRVWNFAYFSVIYQLSSSDLVTELAFSPDCRRFYDLRGRSVNAWESNSLIRFSESDEAFSDTSSEDQTLHSVSQASEAYLTQYEAVSVLAIAPSSSLYCVGNEEGTVDLFDARAGKVTELASFMNMLSVSHLVWSEDAKNIACADLGGDIIVKRLVSEAGTLRSSTKIESMPSPKIALEGRSIHQLLFSQDARLLLIITDDHGYVWAIYEGVLRVSTSLKNGASRRWLPHPLQKHLFLGFGAHDVKVYQWRDFVEQPSLRYQVDGLDRSRLSAEGNSVPDLATLSINRTSENGSASLVNRAMATQDGRHVLIQIKDGGSGKGQLTKRLLILDNSTPDSATAEKSTGLLTFRQIPPDIVARVEIPLGILAGSRLVFLDQDLWVCTFQLGSYIAGAIRRHYFIPRDWANTEALEQCCMMEDGTLLCPREDRVAVITSSLVSGF
ncbi:hypothetical protein VTN96DRAFT_7735 [Rasamsonia emersonii]